MQRSDEWYAARAGNVTASVVDRIARKKDGSWYATAESLLWQKVAERVTGMSLEKQIDQFRAVSWGIEQEAAAVLEFERITGLATSAIPYIPHRRIAGFGGSPDRMCSDGAPLEMKCPESSTYARWCCSGPIVVPDEHVEQVDSQLACIESPHSWFAAYDPRMPADRRMFIVKVPRVSRARAIEAIEDKVQAFIHLIEHNVNCFRESEAWQRAHLEGEAA